MDNWVISPFLTESHIKILHTENMLKDFSLCSKPVIVNNIINYINSGDNEEVKSMLLEAYGEKISFLSVQNDTIMLDNVDKVYQYSFSSVHAGLSIQDLENMRTTINSVYNDKNNVPYVNTIPGDIIAGIINNLLALYRVNKNIEYKRLSYILTKNKELFKDKPNANAKGTIFKDVSRRSLELDIILNGIKFLIDRKTNGKQPESWRLF